MKKLLLLALLSTAPAADYFELPPIRYSETASTDQLAQLSQKIEASEWAAPSKRPLDFLRSVLDYLDIPESSQVLVFSKTSLQNDLISPRNPRALYFSANAYVGWIPGGLIEAIVFDKNLGPVFYTIRPPLGDTPPSITRATDSCLQCHATSRTESVPGFLIRSVATAEDGHLILRAGTNHTDDRSPISERWGGWYVTGQTDDPHLGNRTLEDNDELRPEFKPKKGPTYQDLTSFIDTSRYLQPTSDITALLVLEHQGRMHNLLTKAKYEYQRTLWFHSQLEKNPSLEPGSALHKRARELAEDVLKGLLFTDEAPLGSDGVEGSTAFAKDFTRKGPEDSKGNNLRDLRLYLRIFKHRCSFLIYSESFQALPDLVRSLVLQRLQEILLEPHSAPPFDHLKPSEKTKIFKILEETLPEFAAIQKNGST